MSVHRRVRCTDGLLLNHRVEVDILSPQIQLCQCQGDGNLVAATSFVSAVGNRYSFSSFYVFHSAKIQKKFKV